jgi:hypothetical protein
MADKMDPMEQHMPETIPPDLFLRLQKRQTDFFKYWRKGRPETGIGPVDDSTLKA